MSKNKKKRSKKKSTTRLNTAPRNPFVDHPLIKKGGVHQKSKSAARAATNRELRYMTRDWSTFYLLLTNFVIKQLVNK